MIKANELKLGIYLNRNYDLGNYEDTEYVIQCVDLEVFECMAHDADWIKNLHPIPLTEEWLVRFGIDTGRFGIFGIKKIGERWMFLVYQKGVGIVVKQINYVHEFQNITFALTNTELTIKEGGK